jgi:mono/diheme cytochrome c family protein
VAGGECDCIIFTLISIVAVGYAALSRGAIPPNADAPAGAEKFIARTDLRAVLHSDAPRQSNPIVSTDANLIAGIRLYATRCVICHGSVAANDRRSLGANTPKLHKLAINGVEDDPEGWTSWKAKHGIR